MPDIVELERRIMAALDRIGTGLEGLPIEPSTGQGDPAELDSLREALAAEKEVNAQLEERVKAVRTKQVKAVRAKMEGQITELEDKIVSLKTRARGADVQAQRLSKTNRQLRQSLETLRAARDGDLAELDAILVELKPLLEERANA